jgi:hypothetical protein
MLRRIVYEGEILTLDLYRVIILPNLTLPMDSSGYKINIGAMISGQLKLQS